MQRTSTSSYLAGILLVAASACAPTVESDEVGPTTTLVSVSTSLQAPSSLVTSSTTSVDVEQTTTTGVTATSVPTTSNANPLGGDSPEDFLMPNVLCMSLQEGQDEIQDRGVFFSQSEDATGEGRMQLNDRNWIVVDQYPTPGTPIGEGDAILYVVKFGEDTGGRC